MYSTTPYSASDFQRLQRRIDSNPFYNDAVKILQSHGLTMYHTAFGPAGGVHLKVIFVNKQGKEVTYSFLLEAKRSGMAAMQWSVRFRRELQDLMQRSGLSAPSPVIANKATPEKKILGELGEHLFAEATAKAMEKVASSFVKSSHAKNPESLTHVTPPPKIEPEPAPVPEPEPEVTIAPKSEPVPPPKPEPSVERPKPIEQPSPVPMAAADMMRVVLSADVETLITLLELAEGAVTIDNDREYKYSVIVSMKDLPSFLTNIHQSSATLIETKNASYQVGYPTISVATAAQKIMAVMLEEEARKGLSILEIGERIKRKFGKGEAVNKQTLSSTLYKLKQENYLERPAKAFYKAK